MDPSLPPFGIRHLRDDQPYSIVQVNEQQYQTTIESHPDACLTYVDEDDGENVTVGSALELKQRLEEPAGSMAPLRYCYNMDKNEFEDRLVHLFDIQRTNTTRLAWEEHQARYDQGMIEYGRARDRTKQRDSVSSIDLNSIQGDGDRELQLVPDKHSPPSDKSMEELSDRMIDAVHYLMKTFTEVIQVTSETLHQAATKIRESDTSAAETLASGIQDVTNEMANFVDALRTKATGRKFQTALSGVAPAQASPEVSNIDAAPSTRPHEDRGQQQDPSDTAGFDQSSFSVHEDTESGVKEIVPLSTSSAHAENCKFCSTCKLHCQKGPDFSGACHNCLMLGQTCSFTSSTNTSSAPKPEDLGSSPVLGDIVQCTDDSILDQDTEDADFSRRYPPLMSLRRANTVDELHGRSVSLASYGLTSPGLTRHDSWAQRHPHRPTPQVLDAETQRRRDFARDCFPTQEYSPGPGTQECKLPSLSLSTKGNRVTFHPDWCETQDSLPWQLPETAPDVPQSSENAVEPPQRDDVSTQSSGIEAGAVDGKDSSVQPYWSDCNKTSLPGAWPEATDVRGTVDATQEESSGAFFHRMMREKPSWKQEDSATTAETKAERDARRRARKHHSTGHAFDHHTSHTAGRVDSKPSRHRSFNRPKSNKNPFSDLNRSHTVSSATNPASRLNRPFDPLYPVVAPGSTAFKKPDTVAAYDDQGNSAQDKPAQTPSKAAERQFSIHRYFSPVWEEDGQFRARGKIQNAEFDTLDQNGESISMYSPPPRHMRSVPNFATTRTVTTHLPRASAHSVIDHIASARAEASSPESFAPSDPSVTLDVPSLPFQVMFNGGTHNTSATPVSSAVVPDPEPSGASRPRTPYSQFASNNVINDNSLASDEALQKCLSTLQDMGYGEDDHHLWARLHVYAEAAHGDVMEAVDMIEEDKRAHFGAVVEGQLAAREDQGFEW